MPHPSPRTRERTAETTSQHIIESVTVAYKGAPIELQSKIRRVMDVWRQRSIFDPATQEAAEAAIEGIEKSRPAALRKPLGGALFPTADAAGSVPAALKPLVQAQQSIEKAELSIRPTLKTADEDYTALTAGPLPSPPLLAARLSALARTLATAETAVADTLQTRQSLVAALEKLLTDNAVALQRDRASRASLQARRAEIEGRRSAVEDAIMRGLALAPADAYGGEPPRPDVERLTPPPAAHPGSTTPPGLPADLDPQPPEREDFTPPPPPTDARSELEPKLEPDPSPDPLPDPADDARRAADPRRRGPSEGAAPANGRPPSKKRKAAEEDFLAGLVGEGGALEGLDAEVVGMLG